MMEKKIKVCSERLYEWAQEKGLQNDPEILPKMYDEARRKWPKLTSLRIGQILGLAVLEDGANLPGVNKKKEVQKAI